MYRQLLFTLFILSSFAFACPAQIPFDPMNLSPSHDQVVLVTAEGWSSRKAILQMYEKTGVLWKPVGKKIEVVLGKNGLGWGRGLHQPNLQGPEKTEGDGKAPAGIFEFGNAFGYEIKGPVGIKMHYRQSTDRDYWVDAVSSADYNTWVSIPANKENNPNKYWSSFERMKRQDHLYELGLVVKHNMDPPLAPKGSGIFLHVWRMPGSATLGCTAMSKEDLTSVLLWLDAGKNPLLIQAPKGELNKLKQSNHLPLKKKP
jgi:L,D-peptidoglycan transpeptidase YkuD (ErfK/YbiS/YcfS/YnhG family)